MNPAVRPAAVAGRFYPGQPQALRDEIERCLQSANPASAAVPARAAPPKVLLVPHAGYVYSGPIAAAAYACLAPWRDRIRRVVLLGPTHRVAVRGLALPGSSFFATPLGQVPIDRAALAAIADLPQVLTSDAVHADEHALEVQLPFLQRVLGEFALVPLAVGAADPQAVAQVLERLWGGEETLIVVSSDLSHYLPYAEAHRRDRATIERVLRLDPALDHDEACGATPLAAALIAARRHGLAARLLDLRNSGDTAGDRRRVVGYAAVVFEPASRSDINDPGEEAARGDAAAARPPGAGEHPCGLGELLISQARAAIASSLGVGAEADLNHAAHPALAEPGATFVTLRRRGVLRGCIGTLRAHRPLLEDVRAHAVAAAFADSRFEPLAAEELADLEIEVSLLEPAEALAVADEAEARAALQPGVDGVVLEWRGRRATFLPQVWDQLPEPARFLGALRAKAGLPADFWAEDLRLSRYRVRKFPAHEAEEAV